MGIGSAVHSLALVADSFHMVCRLPKQIALRVLTPGSQLNDVLSLCVGLWAVKVANQKPNSKKYTYGVSNPLKS